MNVSLKSAKRTECDASTEEHRTHACDAWCAVGGVSFNFSSRCRANEASRIVTPTHRIPYIELYSTGSSPMSSPDGPGWLDKLAETRAGRHAAGALQSVRGADGRQHVRLQLAPFHTSSSRAVVTFLLQEFTARGSGSSLLARSVSICLEDDCARDPSSGLAITFHNPGPLNLTHDQLRRLATRFEAYLDYQSKAGKAALNSRMRRHCSTFQRQLMAVEQPPFTQGRGEHGCLP